MADIQEAKKARSTELSVKGKRPTVKRPAYKVGRLHARLAPDQKDLLERAAELTSQSLSDFVVHTALEQARRIILEQQVLELSERDSEIFVAVMFGDSGPNEALKRAAATHAELVAK